MRDLTGNVFAAASRSSDVLAPLSQSAVDDLKEMRRRLHRAPEVGLRLPNTQRVVRDALADLPVEITAGRGLDSLVAVLRGTAPGAEHGPTVLLRADMDALPMREKTGVPFASEGEAMHACGHDLHTSALVGAARALAELRDELVGNVLFMFQPGEEGHGGARLMIEEGLLAVPGAQPSAAYALHVVADMPLGLVRTRPGPLTAAYSTLDIEIRGRGAHGARPYEGADPMPVAAEIVTAIYNYVDRRFSVFDPAIVTVGAIEGGRVPNVVPESVTLRVGLRSFSEEVLARLETEIPALAEGIAVAHGISAATEWQTIMPPSVNDPEHAALVASVATQLFGADRYLELPNPRTGSEDFSEVLRLIPGAYAYIGAAEPANDGAPLVGNHSPLSRFDDDVLADTVRLLSSLALHHLIAPLSNPDEARLR